MAWRPRVRPLQPVQLPPQPGQEDPHFLLNDGANLAGEQIIVSLLGLVLVELADGSRLISEIADQMATQTGVRVTEEQIVSLLSALDDRYLVDNERARARLAELTPRPARHAGGGYPAKAEELIPFLDQMLGLSTTSSEGGYVRASVLPHIDFYRGRDSYRSGYQNLLSLRTGEKPLTVVILGISHAYCTTPFILTRKDFETPLGLVPTDQDLITSLEANLPFDPYLDEYNHLAEHSVEFHAVLLQHLVGANRSLRIVPVLCRSFHQAIIERTSPLTLPGVAEFLNNLSTIRDSRPDVHFLASVDLAHMGLNFGGQPLSLDFLARLQERDLESLAALSEGKADDFFATHQADQGERNYCGTPAIYTLLILFPEEFRLHNYQQCTDPDLGSTVTICSATLSPIE